MRDVPVRTDHPAPFLCVHGNWYARLFAKLLYHTWSVRRYRKWVTKPKPRVQQYSPSMGLKTYTNACAASAKPPVRHLTVFAPPFVHADAIVNFAYRGGLRYRMRPAYIAQPPRAAWDQPGTILKRFRQAASFAGTGKAALLAESVGSFNGDLLNEVAPGPNNVVVLEDPVTHFLRLWDDLGATEEPVEFFSNYDHYGMFKFANFSNPQTYSLFGIRYPSREQIEEMRVGEPTPL